MTVTYRSTRGAGRSFTFEEALLSGLAPDGGLFIPEAVPAIPEAVWRSAGHFPALALGVLGRWLGDDVPEENLGAIVGEAFAFPTPLVPLGGPRWEGVHVLELFHGPTLSFKDYGARLMARLMGFFLAEDDEPLTILVATSGDTGSAVADGFAGQDKIRVVLLYPKGGVSPVQERQLVAARPGVQTYAVAGTFDDCQRMVKEAFGRADEEGLALSSANSINIGRLLPQMLYYLWAVRAGGFEVPVFCVPSGNLGNLTGGMLAALGGMPVKRFLAAHNANDFFPRLLAQGEAPYQPTVATRSNAMDVGVPSNAERLRALLTPEELRARIWGTSVSDAATLASMRQVHDATGYMADPHTAVGLEAAVRYRAESGDDAPIVVLSTAHPAKFPETVEAALGVEPETPSRLAALFEADANVDDLPPKTDALLERLRIHA